MRAMEPRGRSRRAFTWAAAAGAALVLAAAALQWKEIAAAILAGRLEGNRALQDAWLPMPEGSARGMALRRFFAGRPADALRRVLDDLRAATGSDELQDLGSMECGWIVLRLPHRSDEKNHHILYRFERSDGSGGIARSLFRHDDWLDADAAILGLIAGRSFELPSGERWRCFEDTKAVEFEMRMELEPRAPSAHRGFRCGPARRCWSSRIPAARPSIRRPGAGGPSRRSWDHRRGWSARPPRPREAVCAWSSGPKLALSLYRLDGDSLRTLGEFGEESFGAARGPAADPVERQMECLGGIPTAAGAVICFRDALLHSPSTRSWRSTARAPSGPSARAAGRTPASRYARCTRPGRTSSSGGAGRG